MLNLKNSKNLEDIIKTDFEGKTLETMFLFENDTKLPKEYSYRFYQNQHEDDNIDYEDGLYREITKETKRGPKTEHIFLTDALIYINSNVYSIENNNYNYEIISITRNNKNKYNQKSAMCTSATLGQKSLLIKFLNNELNISANELNYIHFIDYFNKFIYENRHKLLTKNAIQHLGWHNKEFTQYSDNIIFDYSDDNDDNFRKLVNATNPKGSFKEWKNIINTFNFSKDFSFIMGTSFASPLLQLVGRRSYQIIGVGDSENAKSFAGACGISIWGNHKELMIGSSNTENYILKKAAVYKSIFMMIDDPFKKGDNQKGIFDNYMIPNEKGKGRLNKNSKMMGLESWRLTSFIATENFILSDNCNAGEYNRVLEYPISKMYKMDKRDLKPFYTKLEQNCGHAGKYFISEILKYDKKELQIMLKKIEDSLYSKYQDEKLDSHIDCVSMSILGLYLGNKIIMGNDDFDFAVDCGCYILDKLMSKFEAKQEIKAVEQMYSYYEMNQSKFSEDQKLNEKLGCIRNRSIIFIVHPLKKHLEGLGYNFKNFKKYLIDNKLAEYKKVKINQQSSWRLVVPFQTQEEVQQIVNLYYANKDFEIKTIEIDLNNHDELKKLEIGIKYFELKDGVPIPFDIGQIEQKYNKVEREAIVNESENELPLPNEF